MACFGKSERPFVRVRVRSHESAVAHVRLRAHRCSNIRRLLWVDGWWLGRRGIILPIWRRSMGRVATGRWIPVLAAICCPRSAGSVLCSVLLRIPAIDTRSIACGSSWVAWLYLWLVRLLIVDLEGPGPSPAAASTESSKDQKNEKHAQGNANPLRNGTVRGEESEP